MALTEKKLAALAKARAVLAAKRAAGTTVRTGARGRPAKLPAVGLLPDEYLTDCVREASRRAARIVAEAQSRADMLRLAFGATATAEIAVTSPLNGTIGPTEQIATV